MAHTNAAKVVLLATVATIDPSAADRRKPWLVTVKVERVLSGRFPDAVLRFPVHSPEKSGLQVGKTYEVRAERTGSGYEVDEFQWLRVR